MLRRPSFLAGVVIAATLACADSAIPVDPLANKVGRPALGFDEYGYNEVAGIFNGAADGVDRNLDGKVWGDPTYANDHLVMKWNSEWDRGNDEDWLNPPYRAWTNNEWNGQVPGGSGESWIYRIVWVGDCVTTPSLVPAGGYCIWNQFAVIFSLGTAGAHFWDAHAHPTGYGAYP